MKKDLIREKFNTVSKAIPVSPLNDYEIEREYKRAFKQGFLEGMLSFLEKQHTFIGQEVFKLKKSFSYTDEEEYLFRAKQDTAFTWLNPREENPVIFTEVLYTEVEHNYIEFRKERLIENLTREDGEAIDTFKWWRIQSDKALLQFLKEL